MYTPPENQTPEMVESLRISNELCRMLLESDAIVLATPMYNFSVPSVLKAYIDNIVRSGVTFAPGGAEGYLTRQKVLFITTRGADYKVGGPYEELDALTPVLKAAFSFIGVKNPQFVNAQPLQFAGIEAKNAALKQAYQELDSIAQQWAIAG